MLKTFFFAGLTGLGILLAEGSKPCRFSHYKIYLAGENIDKLEEVSNLYTALIRELGGELSPELRSSMADGDPFSIPKTAKLKSGTLQESLNELRELIGEIGLEKDAVLERLRADLKKSIRNVETVSEQVKKVVVAEAYSPILKVQPNSDSYVRESESGEYLYRKINIGNESLDKFEIYDSNNKRHVYGDFGIGEVFVYAIDKKGQLIAITEDTIYSAEILDRDGKLKQNLQFSKIVDIPKKHRTSAGKLTRIELMGDYLGLRIGSGEPGVVNLKTKKVESLPAHYHTERYSAPKARHFTTVDGKPISVLIQHKDIQHNSHINVFHDGNNHSFSAPELSKLNINSKLALTPGTDSTKFYIAAANYENNKRSTFLVEYDLSTNKLKEIPIKGERLDFVDSVYRTAVPDTFLFITREKISHGAHLLNAVTGEMKRIQIMDAFKGETGEQMLKDTPYPEIVFSLVPKTNTLLVRNPDGTRYYRLDISKLLQGTP